MRLMSCFQQIGRNKIRKMTLKTAVIRDRSSWEIENCRVMDAPTVWQYGLWSFQTGGTKLERFLPKNQHTRRKFLNFENWTSGELQ